MGGRSTLRTRIKALDRVFGEWVRKKDAKDGMVLCVTCQRRGFLADGGFDAGHFWKRQHQATRFDPANVHVQCKRCNNFRGGAEAEHAAYIIREHGLAVFQELEARHYKVKKWTREEIESLIGYYKQKLEELG